MHKVQARFFCNSPEAQKNLCREIGIARCRMAVVHFHIETPAQIVQLKTFNRRLTQNACLLQANRQPHGVERGPIRHRKTMPLRRHLHKFTIKTDMMPDQHSVAGTQRDL